MAAKVPVDAYEYDDLEHVPYYDFKKYQPGERMLIETSAGYIFDGIYSATESSGENGLIRLHSLRALLNDNRTSRARFSKFAAKEVKSIRFFLPEVPPNGCIVSPFFKKLTFSEYDTCCYLCLNYQYVPIIDKNFYDAIVALKDADVIAVELLGADIGKLRNTNISLLIIATKTDIYLFDLVITPKSFFEYGLKEIFECNDIIKVIYDSRVVCDIFYNRFWKTELRNSYDLLIADYTVLKKNDRLKDVNDFRDIGILVDEYLDVPASIYMDVDFVKTKDVIYDRPMRSELKELASLKVVFYIHLWNEINAELNKEFNTLMQDHINGKFKNIILKNRHPANFSLLEVSRDKTLLENQDDELIETDNIHLHLHNQMSKFKESLEKETGGDCD